MFHRSPTRGLRAGGVRRRRARLHGVRNAFDRADDAFGEREAVRREHFPSAAGPDRTGPEAGQSRA